jgi:integrase
MAQSYLSKSLAEPLYTFIPDVRHITVRPTPSLTVAPASFSSGLRSLWRVTGARTGLVDVRLHDLRGKAGSDMETYAEAQQLRGHSDSKVTRRHYRRKVVRSKPTR